MSPASNPSGKLGVVEQPFDVRPRPMWLGVGCDDRHRPRHKSVAACAVNMHLQAVDAESSKAALDPLGIRSRVD